MFSLSKSLLILFLTSVFTLNAWFSLVDQSKAAGANGPPFFTAQAFINKPLTGIQGVSSEVLLSLCICGGLIQGIDSRCQPAILNVRMVVLKGPCGAAPFSIKN